MLILLLLFFLFCTTLAFSFLYDDTNQKNGVPYALIVITLFLISVFRPIGIDCDSENYVSMYNGDMLVLAEYSFNLIADFAYYVFHDYRVMFAIYAIIGILLKLFTINKITPLIYLTILIYLSNFYILHDFTQIRAGASSALFFVALKYLLDNRRIPALIFISIAVFLHYSSLAYLPLLILTNSSLSKGMRWVLAAAVPISYLIYFSGINLITAIPIPFIGAKLELYQQLQEAGDTKIDHVNVFNMVFLVKILIYYILLWKYDVIKEKTSIISLLLKIYALSIVSLIVLTPLPVLSFRVSELYGVVEIILIPLLYYAIKPRWASRLIVAFIAFVIMSINIFYNELIRFS